MRLSSTGAHGPAEWVSGLNVEVVLRTGNEAHPGKIADLQMLIISGGRERTLNEYQSLLVTTGFALGQVIPTASPVTIVEGIRI